MTPSLPRIPARITPDFDPALAFELRLPPEWVAAPERRAELLGWGLPPPLVVFEGVAGRAMVVVTATDLRYEVDVEDWCRFEAAHSGWAVLSSRVVELSGVPGRELVTSRPGGPVRCEVSLADRGRLVQLHTIARGGVWPAWLDGSDWGFRLMRAARRRAIEQLVEVRLGGGAFVVDIPASWNVRAPHGHCGHGVDLVLDRQTWIGLRLAARAARAVPVARRRGSLLAELELHGIHVDVDIGDDRPRASAVAAMDGWLGGRIYAGVAPGPCMCEVRIWQRALAEHEVDAILVVERSPARRVAWMRAIRALELAMGSIRVGGSR